MSGFLGHLSLSWTFRAGLNSISVVSVFSSFCIQLNKVLVNFDFYTDMNNSPKFHCFSFCGRKTKRFFDEGLFQRIRGWMDDRFCIRALLMA